MATSVSIPKGFGATDNVEAEADPRKPGPLPDYLTELEKVSYSGVEYRCQN